MSHPEPQLEPDGGTASRTSDASTTGLRTGGATLAVGAALFVVGLGLHPPPSPDPAVFMATIADAPLRWQAAHVVTALALFAFTVASLAVLAAGSRLTRRPSTMAAWAALAVGAVWVTTSALAEATVVTTFARAGDGAGFEAWQLFAEVHSAAFVAIAGSLAVIALGEARSEVAATPGWAASVGALAGSVALVAYVLGIGLGVPLAGPVWLLSTIVAALWTLWFGVRLARSPGPASSPAGEADATGQGAVQ